MDEDFAVTCPLVRPGLPQIRFLFVRSRFCSALLSDAASRRRPCASLALHLHQVVQGTCTPQLSNMLGTQVSRCAAVWSRLSWPAVEPAATGDSALSTAPVAPSRARAARCSPFVIPGPATMRAAEAVYTPAAPGYHSIPPCRCTRESSRPPPTPTDDCSKPGNFPHNKAWKRFPYLLCAHARGTGLSRSPSR